MRIPSRQMPKAHDQTSGWFGTVLAFGLVALVLTSPGLIWWPLALVLPALFVVETLIASQRDRQIARIRRGESICEFARAFDCRTVDTWIIRAVYEELSGRFPVRASDRLKQDLHIDGEDLDDMAAWIAQRVGRSLERTEDNPLFAKVMTLHDVVMFLYHQPPVGALPTQQRA